MKESKYQEDGEGSSPLTRPATEPDATLGHGAKAGIDMITRVIKPTQLHASESVTAGHPDKICDQIAAEILDQAIIICRPFHLRPRVAIEVSVKGNTNGGTLMIFGEVTLPKGISLHYADIARRTLKEIGYTDPKAGFHSNLKELIIRITQQSADINKGVTKKRTGAGDQGLMFGAAVEENPQFMPMPIVIAHDLTLAYTKMQKTGLAYLRPDGKAQVVLIYKNGRPAGVHKIILAASHKSGTDLKQLREDIIKYIIRPTLETYGFSIKNPKEQIIINGAGEWTVYGPLADAGTTNRKIIVDSYGGQFAHGGGGFNGKDPTKVDLAGAVGARFVAKRLVAEGYARKIQIEISYVIGQPDPLSVNIETFDTEKKSKKIIQGRARELLNLSVDGIIEGLHLFQPIYAKAAVGGFFGREIFPWEQAGKK
jgi:S-adenosylmethionine synthetase